MARRRAISIGTSDLKKFAVPRGGKRKRAKNRRTFWTLPQPIVSPEEKAAESSGRIPGRITFDQYLALVGAGYDGDVIRRWTRYRAAEKLRELRS